MTPTDWPPYIWFFLAALLVMLARGATRRVIALAAPVISGAFCLGMEPGYSLDIHLFGMHLQPWRVDRLSLLFVYLFHLAAFIAILYSLHVRDRVQQVAGLLYAGSAVGAVLAGDLLTLFLFWELLALTSVFLIWARRTAKAIGAGLRYLVVQILSGVLLLAGALLQWHETGSLTFGATGLNTAAGCFLFLAFGIKCGFPLLHNWITDAYPEATATGAVFLSAFTTKVAIYALARGFAGETVLVYIGTLMACFPIFYAVIENDLRRVLAYSLINQLGFMVCAIGIGTALALNGAVAQAFTHVIFKGLLFMSMGAVLHMTGRSNGSDLGGLYKSMPKTATLCIIGAASISAFPLFSGFVSKSMIMSAVIQADFPMVWLALLFASAGVFHHAGIKIPYFAFFAHDSGIRTREPPANMLAAMAIAAAACILIGVFPALLYDLLPWSAPYSPYDFSHVLAQLQLLFFSALAFVWLNLRGLYPPELRSVNLDADWFYRRLGSRLVETCANVLATTTASLRTLLLAWLRIGSSFLPRQEDNRLEALLSRSGMLVCVAILLVIFVLFSRY